jgi:signal transduction histidine kinase/ligand-binding sensor domain-containing protein
MFNIFSWLRLIVHTGKFFFFLFITISLLLIHALLASDCHAQQGPAASRGDQYRVVHWTLDDGLTDAKVTDICKDRNGFMWIGTINGLNRFDGSLFKKYFHDPHDARSIAGNDIWGIIEDSLHNIWIGTDRGMSRYDIRADTFTNFLASKNIEHNLKITPFWATRDELYAFEAESLLTVYDIHSFVKKTLIKLTPADSVAVVQSQSLRHSIIDLHTNSIWLLRANFDTKVSGLLNISLSDGKRMVYELPEFIQTPPINHFADGMLLDQKRNCIWINSVYGLIQFTLADRKFQMIGAEKNFVKGTETHQYAVGIDLDLQGRVWLATSSSKGMLIYDPSDNTVRMPFPEDTALQKIISFNDCFNYCDRDGIIWSGFWWANGLYQFIPFSPAVKLYKPDPNTNVLSMKNAVVSIRGADPGKLVITTFGGKFLFDKQTGQITESKKNIPGIQENGPTVIIPIDSNSGKALVWTNGKIFALDLKTQKSRQIIFKDSLGKTIVPPDLNFSFPFRNSWVTQAAFQDKEYLFSGNWDSALVREVLKIPGETIQWWTVLADDRLLFFRRDQDSLNLTYSYLNGRWVKTANPTDSLQWSSIFFNYIDRSFWVAANFSIIHYDLDFKLIKVYGQEEGLPYLEISGLNADNRGNIWFHTDRSINELNIETGEISTLSDKDGFEKQFFLSMQLSYKDENGDIYYGGGVGGKGFNRISPDKYTNPPSTLYIQSIEVNQKPLLLSNSVNDVSELTLSYTENKISIETGILDFYSKGTSHMRYKLEVKGSPASWQYGPADYIIRFEGLQPGKYTLRMQASTGALQFNGPEKLLHIVINPPWWQTWWFRIVAILFAAALLYGFIQYRSRNLKERNIVLEEKVMQRTNELHTSLAELKTTQDQLIQSEKMASLGELTSGIAHEIKNPLNFINNFSELNMELITEIEAEQIPLLNEKDQAEIRENIKTLKKNSEKINHHGKRIDGIVKGMLQHSRLGNVNKELVNINALCDESLKLAYHGFRAKEKTFNASFETRFDPDIPRIMVIPQDFGRVMLNLINNAFYTVNEKKKQSQSESLPDALETESLYKPVVIVSTKRSGNKIFITVSDNGSGIPPAIINKIFQPFFTTKPTGEGTGLGLSMSYDIITKSHGGELRAKSKEGLGTDFEIILPV